MASAAENLYALKIRAVAAAHQARDPATLLQVQRDIVTGAERVYQQAVAEDNAFVIQDAEDYLLGARAALVRLDARAQGELPDA